MGTPNNNAALIADIALAATLAAEAVALYQRIKAANDLTDEQLVALAGSQQQQNTLNLLADLAQDTADAEATKD